MADPTYPLFPIFAFLGFILVLVPLPWHLKAYNAGTCLFILWTALACLNQFVNAVVWHNNALNPAPVWCDISTRIMIGSAVGIPASSLCINRRLYKIASAKVLSISLDEKNRILLTDLAIALGVPVVDIILSYIVTGHRFNILEDVGCYPAIVDVWLTYPLFYTWPLVLGLISAVYCIMTLHAFQLRRAQFNEMIASKSSLTANRYFRLMALATTELSITTPLAIYNLYLNSTNGAVLPYLGWDDLHFDFSRVEQIPAVLWRMSRDNVIAVELTRWLVVVSAVIFFLFFGLAEESRSQYRHLFWSLAERLGYKRTPTFQTYSVAGTLPVFVSRPPPQYTPHESTFSHSAISHATTVESWGLEKKPIPHAEEVKDVP